jgi:hypothetical protein
VVSNCVADVMRPGSILYYIAIWFFILIQTKVLQIIYITYAYTRLLLAVIIL